MLIHFLDGAAMNLERYCATSVYDVRSLLILTVFHALVVGCNHGANLRPTTTMPTDQVQLTCIGEEWDAYGNFLTVLRLDNRSQRSISYSGYSDSFPVYREQLRGSNSEGWRDRNSGWCGVGLGKQQLRAQQSVTLKLPPPGGAYSWRIGINIDTPDARLIWSDAMTANAEQVRESPSAAGLVQAVVVKHPDREFPYTFILKNVSGRPLFYGGYREPDVPPIYLIQENRPDGWHDDGKADWSGSGFGFKELTPGGSLLFSIPAQSLDSKWRIGIRLFKNVRPAYNDAFSPVWWVPLPPRNRA
jgi:hypothetical protein